MNGWDLDGFAGMFVAANVITVHFRNEPPHPNTNNIVLVLICRFCRQGLFIKCTVQRNNFVPQQIRNKKKELIDCKLDTNWPIWLYLTAQLTTSVWRVQMWAWHTWASFYVKNCSELYQQLLLKCIIGKFPAFVYTSSRSSYTRAHV